MLLHWEGHLFVPWGAVVWVRGEGHYWAPNEIFNVIHLIKIKLQYNMKFYFEITY